MIDVKTIKSVNLQNNCTYLSNGMFDDYINLENIYNSKNLEIIEAYTFDICQKLSNIQLDETIKYIGRNAFDETSITSIVIPSQITTIYEETFANCKHLKHVVFNKNSQLTEIGKSAFSNCRSLIYLKLPRSLKTINDNAFCNCINLQLILIPKTIDHIKTFAFNDCRGLKYINFY